MESIEKWARGFNRPNRPDGQMNDSFPILIVEDNPVTRKILEKGLAKAGYVVTSVENGREAMGLFDKHFFPIIVTDWMMPEMDGLELCRAIRGRDFGGYVFVILLTVKDSKDDIITGLDAGADEYLIKPFNHAELLARLNTAKRILQLERSLKKANEQIKALSITDPLTKTYNRGYMGERLSHEMNRASRYGHPLSVIISDIDHFKKVNDSYGHQAGDLVLKRFADCIKESIRGGIDWLARYGGEEFLVILPETPVDGACAVAERLRRKVCECVIEIDGKEIRITASFGVAGFSPSRSRESISPESLIRKADKCLYQAKNEGRNRVKSVHPRPLARTARCFSTELASPIT